MGTNFYCHKKDPCPTCGHGGEQYHIGKSSIGWKFLFASYPDEGLTSKRAWDVFLKDCTVIDEYGKEISHGELFDLIESKQVALNEDGRPLLTAQSYGDPYAHRFERLDGEGYRFSTSPDFS